MSAKYSIEKSAGVCLLYEQIDSLIRIGARQKAISIYKSMFAERSAVAAQRLGLYYLTGVLDGISLNGHRKKARAINLKLARIYLCRAFEWGDREAAYNMAWLSYREILSCGSSDLNTKLIELRKWIDIALKYEHGRCRGLLYSLLGSSFCWSENQIQSDDAVKYWKRGARLGDVAAMGELAVAYGWGWGVCKDLRRSLSYFRRVIKNAPFEKRKVVSEVEKICAEDNDLKGALWKAEMRAFLQKLRTSGRSMSKTYQGLLI